MTKNCVFIGHNAGADISEGENLIIIGDNIRTLDKSQDDILFIQDHIAIGIMLFGKPINIKEVVTEEMKKWQKEHKTSDSHLDGCADCAKSSKFWQDLVNS